MVIVKRLYTFMLQRFLPLLAMTFCICLFIVLMQFLWRYIDELVGKGLPFRVIGELFFYAALSMVPTALPLAVLLASLMTFGNLGEKFELTALKAAGISLFKIMRPLIVLMVFIAIGAFFFQNNVLPIAQTKMWTLLFSMRQKSPEIEIPARTFYNQIPGMNLYVEKKDPNTGMLYDLIIYDVSQGLDNSRVILADSGKMNFTEDKTHLFLHLYRGEMFENIRNSALGSSSKQYLPFRRESFSDKQIYMPFDANFNRMDENNIRSQYVGKNVAELSVSIDSIQAIVDSIGDVYGKDLKTLSYVRVPYYSQRHVDNNTVDVVNKPVKLKKPLDIDSVFMAPSQAMARQYVAQAIQRANQQHDNYEFRTMVLTDQETLKNRHGIELHRKFTLSFACLIFFFIGAPLGAIIKKGGIGTPLVISVFLFIFYYIIDNMGFKMARDSKMAVWEGVWLSSAVLLPMGIFFTYKAVGDSAVFNPDAYINFFNRLIGKQTKRSLYVKEVIIDDTVHSVALDMLNQFMSAAKATLKRSKYRSLIDRLLQRPSLAQLDQQMNDMIDYMSNARDSKVIALLNEYPARLNYHNLGDVIKNSERLLMLLDTEGEVNLVIDPTETATRHRRSKIVTMMRRLKSKVGDKCRSIFKRGKKGELPAPNLFEADSNFISAEEIKQENKTTTDNKINE